MESIPQLSYAEVQAAALESFVYQPVSKSMITYLATAAFNVIQCDSSLMPAANVHSAAQNKNLPPTPPRTPEPRSVSSEDGGLPTLEEFITQLVVSSNVQVPTLMSTLVYLTRLKSRLQPMARGLRCTTHRILLAALILSAKYLNDSSPKNKHWANYSHLNTEAYSFGFSRTEVNLMEKQLLYLLDWDLRITEEDLYRELEPFLAPIRERIQAKHARRELKRRMHEAEMQRQKEVATMAAAANTTYARYPSPPASRGTSRSRQSTPEHVRVPSSGSAGPITPPGLSYSSSVSSYAPSSVSSSRSQSRATTPLDEIEVPEPYMLVPDGNLHESPIEIVLDPDQAAHAHAHSMSSSHHHHLHQPKTRKDNGRQLLPYEISAEELRELQDGGSKAKRARMGRGVWGRVFGAAATVR